MIPVMQSKLAELKATGKLIFVELAVYLHHPLKFKKYFSKVICILRKKNIKKTRLFKKNFIPKKFPTIAVGNSQKITLCSNFLCSYFVENYRNIRNLEKQIENFLTFYKK
jgi:dephospho-CoA kinase